MPVWHELTRQARQQDQLVVLGIIQEQHAERCRLFAQWQDIHWPILHDPVNRLGVQAVPLFVAIDEQGIVVDTSLQTSELEAFLAKPAATIEPTQIAAATVPSRKSLDQQAARLNSAAAWIAAGDHRILWSAALDQTTTNEPQADTVRQTPRRDSPDAEAVGDRISAAIQCYQQALRHQPDNSRAWFRLGVAYRLRYDSDTARDGDFQQAVNAWTQALDLDPNHYIYRRRIQQYGPRLSKPYPFYDWIRQARLDIVSRGQVPVTLSVEPVGAEIAAPANSVAAETVPADEPDPQDRIIRDPGRYVHAAATVVAADSDGTGTVRVHLEFRPEADVHWNNEAQPLSVWLKLPESWRANRVLLEAAQPPAAESRETRRLDFELQLPQDSAAESLNGYALYYVCEESGGQCLYRRQDLQIALPESQ